MPSPRFTLLAAALVLLVSGCADVETPPPAAAASPSPQGARCEPAPDDLAFQVTYRLLPTRRKLQRPFMVVEGGRVFLGAHVLNGDGTLRQKGGVWIAKNQQGDQLSALNEVARTESDLPDGRPTFPGAETSPAVAQVITCIDAG